MLLLCHSVIIETSSPPAWTFVWFLNPDNVKGIPKRTTHLRTNSMPKLVWTQALYIHSWSFRPWSFLPPTTFNNKHRPWSVRRWSKNKEINIIYTMFLNNRNQQNPSTKSKANHHLVGCCRMCKQDLICSFVLSCACSEMIEIPGRCILPTI